MLKKILMKSEKVHSGWILIFKTFHIKHTTQPTSYRSMNHKNENMYFVNIYFIRYTIFFLPLNISPSSDIQWNVVAKSCKILSHCDHTLRDLLSIIAKYYGDTVIRNSITFYKKIWFWVRFISIITVICNLYNRLIECLQIRSNIL